MKNIFLSAISLLICGLSLPAMAAINAQLDRDQIGQGETVQLTLQHDGQTSSQPDFSPLKQNFEILGRSTASRIQIINGKMSAQTQLSLTLAPKHGGKLVVPALQWDGQASPALELTVAGSGSAGQAGNGAAQNSSHEFITATLDQKQPYVQAATTLTVRIFVDEPLYQASLELQPNNDVLIQQLGKDRQTGETRNGRNYQVIERKYLLFPQRSGRIVLDGPVLNAQVQDNRTGSDPFFGEVFGRNPFAGMMNATRPLRIQGGQVVLNVRPRPASGTGHDWLPAQGMTLEETWQPDNGPIHVGDPVTRHLHLGAQGLTASQLPDLSLLMPLPPGLRAYPDQPKLDTGVEGDGVIGTRDQDIALIASRAGRYVIPAMHLFWWDTTKNIQREVNLPMRTLDVLPNTAAFSAGTTPSAKPPTASMPPTAEPSRPSPDSAVWTSYRWPWISLGLAMLWLGTLFAWWRNGWRNSRLPMSEPGQPVSVPAATPRPSDARNAFRQACRENAPQAARRHLLDWVRATFPDDQPMGLKAVAERLEAPGLKPLLEQLDRACYSGGEWHGASLSEALKSLPDRKVRGHQPAPELAGLYP